ncbi:MAG: rod shape-determining protein RodA [Actinobacteria bacterium]|nr:rod shape-determining protein RodA [Actinomycetota bacterium]
MAQGIFGDAVDRIGGQPIAARMARKAPIRHLDPTLLLVTLLLSAYGAVMIYSATVADQRAAGLPEDYFLKRQLAFLIAGAVVLLITTFFDYRRLRGVSPVLYGLTFMGLILVLTPLGESVQGAQRWINLGWFQAQPSELMKLVLIITLAAYMAERGGELSGRDIAVAVALFLIPGALIFFQPDLGTMMVMVSIVCAMLLVGGAKIRHFLVLAGICLVVLAIALQAGLIRNYQVDRLTAFLDPDPDLSSEGYNLVQSKIAIGSGGVRGKGFADPEGQTQTALDYVPEQHTDFIFTAVGEQLGFVGTAALLALFAFLLWRALRIATLSRDMFGTLLASGVAALWAFHVFVNVGMTIGIMPITGIPLPFISYGGSSLITNYFAIGLLLNIHMRRFL